VTAKRHYDADNVFSSAIRCPPAGIVAVPKRQLAYFSGTMNVEARLCEYRKAADQCSAVSAELLRRPVEMAPAANSVVACFGDRGRS
jgi:hypothetical protein